MDPIQSILWRVTIYQSIRENWTVLLVGKNASQQSVEAQRVCSLLDNSVADAHTWLSAWANDASAQNSDLPIDGKALILVARTIRTAAIGYSSPVSSWNRHGDLLLVVLRSLRLVNERFYFAGQIATGNWWEWTVGVPQALTDSYMALAEELSTDEICAYSAAVIHHIPDVTRNRWSRSSGNLVMNSANLIDQAQSRISIAVLNNDREALESLLATCEAEMRTVDSGEGMYEDGSYIFHENVAYNGTYGVAAFRAFARIYLALSGTPLAFRQRAVTFLDNFVAEGLIPLFVNGCLSDVVRGRALARQTGVGDSLIALTEIWRYANSRNTEGADEWMRQCEYHLSFHSLETMMDEADESISHIIPLLDYMGAKRPNAAPTDSEFSSKLYARMGRSIHRINSRWVASLAVGKSDVAFFERGNGENRNGYHTGSGMLLLHDSLNPRQYSSEFWAALNPSDVPGTTVLCRTLGDEVGRDWGKESPPNSFGGGVSAFKASVIGCEMHGFGSELVVHKTWVFLPGAVIVMGYIVETGGEDVQTTFVHQPVAVSALKDTKVSGSEPADAQNLALGRRQVAPFRRLSLPGFGVVISLQGGASAEFSTSAGLASYCVVGRLRHGSASGTAFAYFLGLEQQDDAISSKTASPPHFAGIAIVRNQVDAQVIRYGKDDVVAGSIFAATDEIDLGELGFISFSSPCTFVLASTRGRTQLTVGGYGSEPLDPEVVVTLRSQLPGRGSRKYAVDLREGFTVYDVDLFAPAP